MNAALEEIREPYMLRSLGEKPEESDDETSSSASASSAESHNVSKPSRSFRTSYTPSLRAAMVEHIALNPDTPIMTLWRSFHTKVVKSFGVFIHIILIHPSALSFHGTNKYVPT